MGAVLNGENPEDDHEPEKGVACRPLFACFLWSLFFHAALFASALISWRIFDGPRLLCPEDEFSRRLTAALGPAAERSAAAAVRDGQKAFESVFDFSAGFKAGEKEAFIKGIASPSAADFEKGASPKTDPGERLKQLAEGKSISVSSADRAMLLHDKLNSAFQLFKLSGRKEAELDRLIESGGRGGDRPVIRNHNVRVEIHDDTGTTVVDVPDEIYFRTCPYKSILFQGASLFSIHRKLFDPNPPPPPRTIDSRFSVGRLQPVFFVNIGQGDPLRAEKRKEPAAPKFRWGPEERAAYLDRLMSLTEIDQLAAFDKAFLKNHDPDDPDLARFINEFIYTNLNSVFVGINDVSLAFDYLEELYYKRPIYDFFLAYWNRYPQTRTGREFLLALAGAYEFEKRVLTALFASYGKARAVLGEGQSYRLYQEKLKSYTIKEIVDDLWSRDAGPSRLSLEGSLALFNEKILAIYDWLGRRRDGSGSRALFMKGRFLWDHNDAKGAVAVWRAIPKDYDNAAFQSIRPDIESKTAKSLLPMRRIENSLKPGTAEDDTRLLSRLLKYRKWSNRSEKSR
jgi:hypothetical protein